MAAARRFSERAWKNVSVANRPVQNRADQTELYSQKKWVSERFCEADILASPALEIITLD